MSICQCVLCPVESIDEEDCDEEGEKALLQLHVSNPAGPPLSQVLRDPEERRKLGENDRTHHTHTNAYS